LAKRTPGPQSLLMSYLEAGMVRDHRGLCQTLLHVREVNLISCTPLILPFPQSSVYNKTRAIRCHAVKNALSQFHILLNVTYEFNKRNFIVHSLFNYVIFCLCTTCNCAVFLCYSVNLCDCHM